MKENDTASDDKPQAPVNKKQRAGFEMTIISALISIAVYGLFLGVELAIWFVFLIFIHEMGHYIMAKVENLDVSVPYFIPFLGAIINMRHMPPSAYSEAKMGLAGPIAGLLATGALLPFIHLSPEVLPQALALSAFINLFNLLPVSPLDGGRAASVLHPIFWVLGLLALVWLTVSYFSSPIMWFIVLVAALDVYTRIQDRRKNPENPYYKTSIQKKMIVIGIYVLLIATGVSILQYLASYQNLI